MTHLKKTLFFLAAGWGSLTMGGAAFAESAQDYEQAGMALFRAGQYEKAIDYFNNAVKADPNDAQAYEDRGDAYMKLNDKANAFSSYQAALQLDPGNPTLQTLVENLEGQTLSADSPAPTADASQQAQAPSGPTTVYVEKRRRFVQILRPLPNYNDGLPLMDHAPVWYRAELAYNYSQQGDLNDSANAVNSENTNGGLNFGMTNAQASASSSGIEAGGEVGFLLSPFAGIALGARVIESSDYNLSAYNSAPSTIFGAPSDFENATFSPLVVPLTLDAYLFLPDKGGRFFISGGIGYYFGMVAVNENYSFSNYSGDPNAFGNPTGNLYAG
ncbi:MAG TPA: tetratricopeptide repeat protein, partial [bacterium]|nr:tetratricopeptide repeat protein [bacterium]